MFKCLRKEGLGFGILGLRGLGHWLRLLGLWEATGGSESWVEGINHWNPIPRCPGRVGLVSQNPGFCWSLGLRAGILSP